MQGQRLVKGLVGWLLLSMLMAGCGAVAPVQTPAAATPLPALIASVTPDHSPAPSGGLIGADEGFAALQAALVGYQNGGDEAGKIIAALSDAVSAYWAETGTPTTAAAEALTTRLQALLPTDQKPISVLADLDGDGRADYLLATPGMFDFPALVFLSTDDYGSRLLPPDSGLTGLNDDLLPAAWPHRAQALDVTGDGQPEALLAFRLPGGSGYTDRLHVFNWTTPTRTFTEIFRATLVTWAGPSTWQTQPGPNGAQDFVLSGPAFGVFDHKLLAHQTRTESWRWSPDAARFIRAGVTLSPPTNRRQAVNQGEAFLRRGDYTQAAAAYRAAITGDGLDTQPETENAPDWAAFAALRLGQTYALDGQEAPARTALQQAMAAGGYIGDLAGAFLNAYHGGATTANAWGAFINRLDLNELLYQEQAGNLGFPMDAFSVYYPGLAVVAYLDAHGATADLGADTLQAALQAAGVRIKAAQVADVDGDGPVEVTFVSSDRSAPDQTLEHAWLAYRQGNRWRVALLTEGPQLTLEKTAPLASRGALIAIRYPAGFEPVRVGYLWRGEKLTRYDLSSGAPTLLPDDEWPTLGE